MRLGVLVLALSGCGTSVTRYAVLDPEHVLALGVRATVVAVNGIPAVGQLGMAAHGYAVYSEKPPRPVGTQDSVKVEITYKDGDTIPGEGVVDARRREHAVSEGSGLLLPGMLIGSMFLAGAIVAQPPSPCSLLCFDWRPVLYSFAAVGGIMTLAGVCVLTSAAAIPIDIGGKRAFLTPTALPGGGGGVWMMHF